MHPYHPRSRKIVETPIEHQRASAVSHLREENWTMPSSQNHTDHLVDREMCLVVRSRQWLAANILKCICDVQGSIHVCCIRQSS